MPCDYRLYPANWKAIRAEILERAGHRCECDGECGFHHPFQWEIDPWGMDARGPNALRCMERGGQKALRFRGRVILTIAHLNNKSVKDVRRTNLKAMCQACHLRMDAPFKAARRRAKNRCFTKNSTETK